MTGLPQKVLRQPLSLPHWLGLDAAGVALTWQQLMLSSTQAFGRWPERCVLGLTVWLIYVADRWRDSFQLAQQTTPTDRHQFSHRYRHFLAFLIAGILCVDAFIAFESLPPGLLAPGGALAAAVAFYFYWTQNRGVFMVRGWHKEAAVGAVFAVGVTLSAETSFSPGQCVQTAAFAVVCFLNCVTISYAERERRSPAGIPQTAWNDVRYRILTGILIAGSGLMAWADPFPLATYWMALGFSTGLLTMLTRFANRIPSEKTGVFADLALAGPALLTSFLLHVSR